ncbi:MAG: glycosyltransferase, partial [Peptococcaceae bacterium]|nr:glycosyltransferase [Peptococcaceae bacterium]
GGYLLRINHERVEDIDRLIQFGRFLKENAVKDIKIDVYGSGDYVDQFTDKILDMELEDYIEYCGFTNDIKALFEKYDFVLDVSKYQSFGMVYIESILNGKMVFCMHNEGSDEVLKDIPECFFETHEELVEKIRGLQEFDTAVLQANYDKIFCNYSRENVTDKFINFLQN